MSDEADIELMMRDVSLMSTPAPVHMRRLGRAVRDAFRVATRCFEVAGQTSSAHERTAAIGRGKAVAARARLDLRYFDIPGEQRPVEDQRQQFCAIEEVSRTAYVRQFARFERTLRDVATAVGARDDETPYDARRRNFEEACRAAKERDRRREAAR